MLKSSRAESLRTVAYYGYKIFQIQAKEGSVSQFSRQKVDKRSSGKSNDYKIHKRRFTLKISSKALVSRKKLKFIFGLVVWFAAICAVELFRNNLFLFTSGSKPLSENKKPACCLSFKKISRHHKGDTVESDCKVFY